MTMLGRGRRSAARKDENTEAAEKPEAPEKPEVTEDAEKPGDAENGKARKAAEQATKAAEAAEAARLAEEAAARAREAARLAQVAADAAADDAEEPDAGEPDAGEPAEASVNAENARKTPEKPRLEEGASDVPPGDEGPAAEESEPAQASLAGVEEVGPGTKPESDDPAADAAEDATTDSDGKADEANESDELEESEKPGKQKRLRRPVRLSKAARAAAADEDDQDAGEEGDEDEGAGRRVAGPGYTVIAVLAVLVIAFGTAATMLFLKDREQNAVDAARRDGMWAASRAAKALSSYDYRTIDADMKTAASMTTGKLRTDYAKQMPSFKAEATQQQLVGTTTVLKTGVISATPDRVEVLVYANRTSATKEDETQRLPESLRLKMTMVEDDGRWLASDVDVIS